MNRLAHATSPYLRQHATNPVDWHEWGAPAFAEARERNLPIFLSIGYSTCHWCHVMAHESFEDPDIARLINAATIPIKVDREELPAVDSLYMAAAQAMRSGGGWPLNVFLTPTGLPFFAGTYFPPNKRPGMASLPQVLDAITHAWQTRAHELTELGEQLRTLLDDDPSVPSPLTSPIGTFPRGPSCSPLGCDVPSHHHDGVDSDPSDTHPEPFSIAAETPGGTSHLASPFSSEDLEEATQRLLDQEDPTYGGFGRAPKFPMPSTLLFLLSRARASHGREFAAVKRALLGMARGGIHDQIGGGFARYSTDEAWRVPHFEKMLNDNALLLQTYARAFSFEPHIEFERAARGIVAWLEREMILPGGGFASALDADSEGVEGKHYTWTIPEIYEALSGDDSDFAIQTFGLSEVGNFEGANVLQLRETTDWDLLADIEKTLRGIRELRARPHRDGKVITAWNAHMIAALAEASTIFNEPSWRRVAESALNFIRTHLFTESDDRRLLRSWCGAPGPFAVLEDVAALARAYVALGDTEAAHDLFSAELPRFARAAGGYLDSADTSLFARIRSFQDGAEPSAQALLAEVLLQADWSDAVGNQSAEVTAEGAVRAGYGILAEVREGALAHPLFHSHHLLVADVAARREVD